jgi:hypothetical protein
VRFAYFFIAAVAMADTLPIADENLRMTALHAIFPGMGISLVPGKRIGNAPQKKRGPYELDATDALAKENVYRMIGKATNEAERCAGGPTSLGKVFRHSPSPLQTLPLAK